MLLAADGIESWDQLQVLLRRLVACVSAIAAIGIAQFATGFNLADYVVIPGLTRQVAFVDLLTRDGINRPSATTAQPLEFAAVLALTLPLALHQARFASSRHPVPALAAGGADRCGPAAHRLSVRGARAGDHRLRAGADLARPLTPGRLSGARGRAVALWVAEPPDPAALPVVRGDRLRIQQHIPAGRLLLGRAVHHPASLAGAGIRDVPAPDVLLR